MVNDRQQRREKEKIEEAQNRKVENQKKNK